MDHLSHETHHHHDHEHPHHTDSGHTPLEETKALLTYMLHHNEHHADELADLLDRLPPRAQKKLRLAIGTFEAANVELQEVLESLE